MLEPGPLNLITDVEGIRVGNTEDARVRTGVTVVLPEPRAASLLRIGSAAADCTARAIMRGVYEAETLGDLVSYRERFTLR